MGDLEVGGDFGEGGSVHRDVANEGLTLGIRCAGEVDSGRRRRGEEDEDEGHEGDEGRHFACLTFSRQLS